MSNFIAFKRQIQHQFKTMESMPLYRVDVDRDVLYDTYLSSFHHGSNEIFRKRREHDCSCCKNFIRQFGNIVAINDKYELVSIWDIEMPGTYGVVAKALSKKVKLYQIKDEFFHYEKTAGVDKNHEQIDDRVLTWEHFHLKLPASTLKQKDSIQTILGEYRDNKHVLTRSILEINEESVDTVLELIDNGSLYRGEEQRKIVSTLNKLQREYVKDIQFWECGNFFWRKSHELRGASRIRGTAIGSLLIDLSEGRDLEAAVKSFEDKVAPTNYKRPKALITEAMIKKAQKTVEDLGIKDSLSRRYATEQDLTINNVVYADKSFQQPLDVFEELLDETVVDKKQLKNAIEIDRKDFLLEIIDPKTESVEILFENKHEPNLVSLIAPVHPDSPNILKWENNFSWSYNGGVTDSIKERVKTAGGNVTGDLRCSLSWFNYDDLDIHITEPDGNHIYYRNKRSLITCGHLDVDMNVKDGHSRSAVENITWPHENNLIEGVYILHINNFTKRETIDVGFDVEIEFKGEFYNFHYPKPLSYKENVVVAALHYDKGTGLKVASSLKEAKQSKELWGTKTQTFRKVELIMESPNHWDDNEIGNKHLFFMIDGCVNQEKCRGLYNEFLSNDLNEHRKVFEVLGNKIKAPESKEQLSGLGFSSTKRDSVYFRVTGQKKQIFKLNL